MKERRTNPYSLLCKQKRVSMHGESEIFASERHFYSSGDEDEAQKRLAGAAHCAPVFPSVRLLFCWKEHALEYLRSVRQSCEVQRRQYFHSQNECIIMRGTRGSSKVILYPCHSSFILGRFAMQHANLSFNVHKWLIFVYWDQQKYLVVALNDYIWKYQTSLNLNKKWLFPQHQEIYLPHTAACITSQCYKAIRCVAKGCAFELKMYKFNPMCVRRYNCGWVCCARGHRNDIPGG